MKKYKEIHIWKFPPTLTFLKLEEKFRRKLFNESKYKVGSSMVLLKN